MAKYITVNILDISFKSVKPMARFLYEYSHLRSLSFRTKKPPSQRNVSQNHKCRDCGRQFVENRQQKVINQLTKDLIDKLLLEKIPLAGIARVTNVSEPWLQSYVNDKYELVSRQIKVKAKKKGNQ